MAGVNLLMNYLKFIFGHIFGVKSASERSFEELCSLEIEEMTYLKTDVVLVAGAGTVGRSRDESE